MDENDKKPAGLAGKMLALAIGITGVLTIVVGLGNLALSERDDSDPPTGPRSGLRIYTDRLTGCQYVGASGGLTLRVDRKGQPLCVEAP